MSLYLEPKFTRADFRQNYLPDPPAPALAIGGHWLLEDSMGRDLLTRVRHQMTQVVDSYRARFKLATTKGSTGRLGSVF